LRLTRLLVEETSIQPVTIDIAGTIEQLAAWVITQILIILAVIAVGLSAPLLYTVGAISLAAKFPEAAPVWALVYLVLGPFACAFWMILLSAFPKFVAIGKGLRVQRDRASKFKATGYMFAGFIGSIIAEVVFTWAANSMFVIHDHLILYFSAAWIAVFAPCWIPLVRYLIHWERYEYVGG
jgi:hypothetical protein